GDRLPFLVKLAPGHREALPELAAGVRPLEDRELAIEQFCIARLRGLQQLRIHGRAAIDTPRADREADPGEGAVGDQFADGAHLRLRVIQIVTHWSCSFASGQEGNAGWTGARPSTFAIRAPRSGGSVRSRRPERSLAGRP